MRDLNDRKGQFLIDGVLEVVDRLKPLHLSIVGGDPLVRYRELESLVPQLLARGIHVQIVTSAFRKMSPDWAHLQNLHIVVSIDGLQPEHDKRRAPATYERILKNIAGQKVTIHCTITAQMMKRPGYLEEFLKFWTPRPEIKKVWFSLFTPQIGDQLPEILSKEERAAGDQRNDPAAKTVRQAGYAGGRDSSVRCAAAQPRRLCVRAHHSNTLRRSANQNHALPVRRKSRLRRMRLHRLHGTGVHRRPQAGRLSARRRNFQSLHRHWPMARAIKINRRHAN